jgi:DNA-binding NtrC family response regulator
LHAAQLPPLIARASAPAGNAGVKPLPEQVADVERNAIAAALRATGGNRVAAARLLKMSRAALYDRLSRYPELQ